MKTSNNLKVCSSFIEIKLTKAVPSSYMDSKTINREASDKTKGFRLQKLRATKLMLEAANSSDSAIMFYSAIENVEDVSITIAGCEETETKFEEDKNYDKSKNFTLFSAPVLNTLVSFFDISVIKWQLSSRIILGFYTTAGIGREKKKKLTNGKKLHLPSDPILKLLSSSVPLDDDIVELVREVLTEEYQNQYKDKKSQGNLQTLNEIDNDSFREFLGQIRWYFGQENEYELKDTILTMIKKCKYHNFRVANKEEIILSLILEKLDERQNLSDYSERFIHSAEIELIFKQAESEESQDILDPMWQELETVEADITDKRNLIEKIRAICPNYPTSKITHLARIACRSKIEQHGGNKSFLSLKYRAFEACGQYFFENDYPALSIRPNDLDKVIKELQETAASHLSELKKDYKYTISNQKSIDGVVLDLIDSCFVSFEDNDQGE